MEEDPNEEADNIASSLIALLIENFKKKQGRDPDNEEIEQLFEELTEERIKELLTMQDDDIKESDTAENSEDAHNEPCKQSFDEEGLGEKRATAPEESEIVSKKPTLRPEPSEDRKNALTVETQ